jgi:histidyl-tRNA synthetase
MSDGKKPKAERRPRAETPRGFRDYFGAEVLARRDMLAAITDVYHRYGFDPLETSAVETVEALGKFLPDVDRPNEGVFGWQENEGENDQTGGDWLALRYDLTAPLARVAAQYRNDLPTPYRRYAFGPVWRNEKPGPGRFRQFYQCDADTVGAASVAADAEICAMLADALEAAGIERGDYVIKVNNRKVLNGVMEVAGVLDPSDPEKFAHERGIVLRAIDKFDRLGEDGVRALLGAGRKDESGDFTKGAGLNEDSIAMVLAVFQLSGGKIIGDSADALKGPTGRTKSQATLNGLSVLIGHTANGAEGITELEQIAELVSKQGYGEDRIVIDTSVVRGLGYYTGPVYEAELTFEILDEKGRKRQFGSVAGGGRYDDLVKRFTGQAVPATGVSIGVDRLLAALAAKGRGAVGAAGPVVVTVMDRDRMADYMAMVGELRNADVDPSDPSKGKIRAEVYLGNPKQFGNQLKYADKRASPIAVIQGGDEAAKGTVVLKDLILGSQIAQNATLEEWKDRPAQVEVPRGDLVAAVQQMLGSGK